MCYDIYDGKANTMRYTTMRCHGEDLLQMCEFRPRHVPIYLGSR